MGSPSGERTITTTIGTVTGTADAAIGRGNPMGLRDGNHATRRTA
jgi:hypothetical protein